MHALRRLLEKFHDAGVRYCHFKSNLHVDAAVEGKTDLDILIDRFHCQIASELLSQNGFKRFVPRLPSSYSAVEDWLGFDEDSGQLFHLHLHWQLIAGEPNLKGYRIPWEQELLSLRKYDKDNQIYVASPELELLLLLVRASLKFRKRNVFGSVLGRPYPAPTSDIVREYLWLLEKVDRKVLTIHAKRLLSNDVATLVDALLDKRAFDAVIFRDIRIQVGRLCLDHRTYSILTRNLYRWFRELYAKTTKLLNQKLGTLIVRRRTPVTGGLTVVLLGVDGSGKSTHVKQLVKWLGWKLDVGYVYFGSGDGPVSLLRKPLVFLRKLRKRKIQYSNIAVKNNKCDSNEFKTNFGIRRVRRFITDLLDILWAMTLLYEKRKNMRRAIQARNKGMVVFCDRFPQNQLIGFNDGPLLSRWLDKRGFYGYFARCEQRGFDEMVRISPDLVIKLNVSEDVAIRRKSDTPIEMVARKIDAVKSLDFGSAVEVLEVDANQDLATVTIELRRKIWQLL